MLSLALLLFAGIAQAADSPTTGGCLLLCPSDLTPNLDAGQCGATVTYVLPATSGDCTGVTVTCTPPPGLFPPGTTVVHCQGTDATANSVARCSFKVTVPSVPDPQMSYPGSLTKCADAGQNSTKVDFDVQAHDNCGTVNVVCHPESGATFIVGTTTVRCSATGASGEETDVSFPVTVNDCSGPQITCPADITKCLESGTCSSAVTFAATATGATVVCAPASGSQFPKGATTVSCTATDPTGKTSHCSFSVTINDCAAPSITCPANITHCTDAGKQTAVVTYAPVATDNCGSASVVCTPASGSEFVKGSTTVSCTATDGSSNHSDCTFTVTVNDCSGPQISCPADITKCLESGSCSSAVTFAATATGATVVCTPASGSQFAKGATTVSCTATAPSGETSHCSFSVTINDCAAPSITCPANITHCTDAGKQTAVVTYAPVATDNCGSASVVCTPASGSEFVKGTTTVSCTATDGSSNHSNCTFTVTVNDCPAGQITCPSDMTVCADTGKCSAVVHYSVTTSSSGPAVCQPNSGAEFPVGVTTVACASTDSAGTISHCGFKVTVNACEPLRISCPANMVKCYDAGKQSAVVTYVVDTSNACGTAHVVCQPASGTEFQKGATTVTCTATDGTARTANCSFTVTVVDCNVPGAACPSDMTLCSDQGTCTAIVNYHPSTAGFSSVVCDPKPGSAFPIGTTTVTCNSTDANGQVRTCGFKVTVNPCAAAKLTHVVPTPDVIWPPNHQMVPITLDITTDNCGTLDCRIVSVTSSEPSNKGHGKQPHSAQWKITGDLTFEAQAERSGNGNGRVYTVTIQCTDSAGAISTSTVTVPVAHDHRSLSHSFDGHHLTLSWDPAATDSTLESTDSLTNPDWKPVNTGNKKQVVVPAATGMKFYRLRQ